MTQSWGHPTVAFLLSDSLTVLQAGAAALGLSRQWLLWSDEGTPCYKLTPYMRVRALLTAACELSAAEEGELRQWWIARHMAVLNRLRRPAAFAIRK